MMIFEILGEPGHKQSARFRIAKTKTGSQYVRSYQKPEVIEKSENMAYSISNQLPEEFIPYDEPITVLMEFVFSPPATMSKKLKSEIEKGEIIYKDKKPDIDNLTKAALDSMAGIVFVNDSRIVALNVIKYYGLQPKTIIEVRSIN